MAAFRPETLELEAQKEPLAPAAQSARGGASRTWRAALAAVAALMGTAALAVVLPRQWAASPSAAARGSPVPTDGARAWARQYFGDEQDVFRPRSLTEMAVSPECKQAMGAMRKSIMDKAVNLGVKVLTACGADKHADKCVQAKKGLEHFEEDLKAECKGTGNMCTLTEITPKGTEKDETCVPKACHKHASLASKAAQEDLRKTCDNSAACSAVVSCASR
mmetsp:Transcript_116177/g.361974  ORF Transcript_116177/g.361974 Transcript_116177/m.361974 type:complete len:220 (-) Transcript_116177:119-778(-)|eukprot:CAMPEP_0204596862 /NCGR_PEP_ID=MMETSP0661-20131031/53486_1 /ASSEMBLY_ACC=CAM_ASM_000606 /TAXON_ID=109239 /ORGANISM="Alexandrium margalefi, Strain AMGDE01CS-322" /LENGTH=219 /DNA_ID=CAMNT_0051607519 /DNA_START=71 /DNA_END=730 /DNA_ORIENTATION=+